MKKTLLLGLLLLGSLGAYAQDPPNGLDDGSNAPDFTITDINNNVHHLQTYLDEGKTVILYCSAVWCGPCWSYHQTHYLSDIYHAYGPEGSNEVVVLYVETDPRTQEGELDGTDLPDVGGETYDPIGNWIDGTPYPIADSDFISQEYVINYFPTIYRICPQGEGLPGKTFKMERTAPQQLVEQLTDGCNDIVGVDHWARVTSSDIRSCDAEGDITATVEGFGHTLESVEATLWKNDAAVATETFTGLGLAAFEPGTIAFEGQELDPTAYYSVSLSQANGAAVVETFEDFVTSESFDVFPNASEESYQNFTVICYTDEYPGEMVWQIINSAGEVVHEQTYANTAANREKEMIHEFTFEDVDCYDILLYDAYGDGWTYNQAGGAVPHGISVISDDVTIFENDGNFGQFFYQQATFHTNGMLGSEEFNAEGFAIYPNPSNGVFNFATQQTVNVTVLDITGKTVHVQEGIANGGVMDLSQLQAGVYIAKVKDENNAERIEKLVIK